MKAGQFFAVFVVSGMILSCGSGSSAPTEIEQAAAMVEEFLDPRVLSQSSFPVVLPDGTPRQFVSWLFSTLGTAEWPPNRSMAAMEFGSAEDAIAAGVRVRPDDVAIVHSRPDTSLQKQIVVLWDDPRGLVLIHGYLDPREDPVLVREIPLPTVRSDNELARQTARSHLEMGGTYQAF